MNENILIRLRVRTNHNLQRNGFMVKGGTGDSEDQHLLLTDPLAQADKPKAQAFFLTAK